jgi:hypothetical protein
MIPLVAESTIGVSEHDIDIITGRWTHHSNFTSKIMRREVRDVSPDSRHDNPSFAK